MATRGEHIVEVYGFVKENMARRTTQAWLEGLGSTDIPHAPISTLEDLFEDPHLKAVSFFPEFDHPSEGRLRTTAIPSQWSASQPDIRRYAPRLGADSKAVLQELGYSTDEIRALVEAGITHLAT